MFPSRGHFPTAGSWLSDVVGTASAAVHLLYTYAHAETWARLVESRAQRILSTGLRSCRDRRLTNYDAGLGIAARSILTISRLAGASWDQPSRTAGLSKDDGFLLVPVALS
jgi:hypothetical protein